MITRYLHKISQRYAPKWLILFIDVCIILSTYFLAHLIRFNFEFEFDISRLALQLPYIAVISLLSLIVLGSQKGVVRFTGFKDILNLFTSINILATVLIVATFVSRKFNTDTLINIPGSIIYIHLLLNIIFLIGFKLMIKSIYNQLIQEIKHQKNVLIFGAGNLGLLTYDAISNDKKSELEVIGFIDDDKQKIGKKINQLRVHSIDHITKEFIEKNNVAEVIVSIQTIESYRLLQICSQLFSLDIKVKIAPPVQNWIDGDLNVGQIHDFKIEDLLGREPISIDNPALKDEYDSKTLLVTGAAGSIGSEIVRKLRNYNYKKLILVDNSESPLYEIQQELKQNNALNVVSVIADVRDSKRMDAIFSKYRPMLVFHAAAYKHVPLMEDFPHEAVDVNIQGTKNIADLSVKHGVEKFVLISTDKAVNPTNVMGATKRIAELYTSCLKGLGKTKFITTRFGNVLGSNGSVIPLFKKQIENGGPITVTHKDITRYFMTIPEACQLVLEAAAMGSGGEIFVFDMGEAIKIYDLAKNMIILSGLRYPEDVDIKISGLRPGEKIFEELLANDENTKPTYHEKIMIAKAKRVDQSSVERKINTLCVKSKTSNILSIVSLIKDLVPEYVSNNSKFEILDNKTTKS
ncbi:nucleoside-diphosphate sugar epimerase/dehydratase [Ichthyenterobacterium sp. W332]|uniref:Nucleoside-diphosphate sugar epimerase/dehydratase n=1 Tax=Microcosmobacter mediterraneus TaxID=3075607 RepID=A0ABU2YKP5_9FLAO|nr:nucleoside-diphosphate sugar epimerase/dehydratase [Ichthyenterobacterium sp. W332]MDT0558723.1 nucleoside-diphosphate sugar epimerase/dehydratase [Ichthyenterobacterium sp. W332]